MELEHDNLRAALKRFDERGEAEHGVRLAGALVKFWALSCHWDEGNMWIQAALAQSSPLSVAIRAKTLLGAGHMAFSLCDFAAAWTYVEEGLVLSRELGDKPAIALALLYAGSAVINMGDYTKARIYGEECLAAFDEIRNQWGRAQAMWLLAGIASTQDDVVRATAYNEEILTFYRQVGYKRGIGISLLDKGILVQLHSDWDRAVALYFESHLCVLCAFVVNCVLKTPPRPSPAPSRVRASRGTHRRNRWH